MTQRFSSRVLQTDIPADATPAAVATYAIRHRFLSRILDQ